jgi:hypothetical protein
MKNHMMVVAIAVMLRAVPVGAQVLPECAYVSNEPGAELEPRGRCATVSASGVSLSPEHLRSQLFSDDGLASLLIGAQHYYVSRAGALLPVIPHDNWADDFSEGLVRSQVGGKIAFFNKEFAQVIEPRYDWAWPFQNGRALVCVGCVVGAPDENGHREVTEGRWGYINNRGTEIVPVRFTREQATKQQ